jgi:hypothetical protein
MTTLFPIACLALAVGSTVASCSDAGRAETSQPRTCKAEFLAIADELSSGTDHIYGRAGLEKARGAVAALGADPRAGLKAHADYSHALLQHGEVDAALVEVDEAIRLAETVPELEGMTAPLWRFRGLAYLRKAEIENCVNRHNAQCCIFPLREGGLHSDREPATEARRSYEKALSMHPDDLGLMWLLNVTAMALGEYPESVPKQWLIPPSSFESAADIGRFPDVARDVGLNIFGLAGGSITEDFDGDGYYDLVTSTSDPRGGMTFHRGGPGMTFEDATAASGLDDQLGGLNCISADYDGDGDYDIYVLRGAWLFDDGCIRKSLLRNDGKAHFVDVTFEAGVAAPAYPTQAACWGDFDNDGDLDLYQVDESRVEIGPPVGDFPSQFYRNDGNGKFTEIAEQAGVTNDRYGKGVAAGDYDNDGDLDIYVSNIGKNRLYRNDGNDTFVDVAEELHVTEPEGRSFACWFFDYDNDGWLDLWVGGFNSTIDDIAADHLGMPNAGVLPCLYHNLGGHFEEVAVSMGLGHPFLPMGANFGDFDNDGFLDIYLGTGDPAYETLTPNVAFRNDAGRRFQDITTSAGLGHLQKGHGIAFADLDEDGDEDVFHQLGGFYPGDRYSSALFENPGHGNHYLHVKLVGTRSNRSAVGARVRVVVVEAGAEREIHRAVGCVSSFGGSPMRQEIGLGKAERILSLRVVWPTTGEVQEFTDVPLDSRIEVVEGASAWKPLVVSAPRAAAEPAR